MIQMLSQVLLSCTRPLNIASQEYQGADYSFEHMITDQAGDFGFSLRGSTQLALKQAQKEVYQELIIWIHHMFQDQDKLLQLHGH